MIILLSISGTAVGGLSAYDAIVSSPDITGITKKKLVVLGTGCAGTSFLRNLKNPSYDIQVISPRNYFAFTPLLPSVTCGTVEARSIVESIRKIVRKVISLDLKLQVSLDDFLTSFPIIVLFFIFRFVE